MIHTDSSAKLNKLLFVKFLKTKNPDLFDPDFLCLFSCC
jgi:hypothetical protein